MKFRTLAIAALLGAMSTEQVAEAIAVQRKHHHHPRHHSKMQTYEEPEKKVVDPEPDFQEAKDKLKKMKKEKNVQPELTEDEAAAKFKKETADLADEAAARKDVKDVKKFDKLVKEEPESAVYKEKLDKAKAAVKVDEEKAHDRKVE